MSDSRPAERSQGAGGDGRPAERSRGASDGRPAGRTYREVLSEATEVLRRHGVPDADLDAWYLLEHVTGMSRAQYFLREREEASAKEQRAYQTLIERRAERIPLQYLTGVQEFMGISFLVSPRTLIPRQDTELLVEEAMRVADEKRVLDLCTGTGCILLSLSKLCKLKRAVGTDLSEEALCVARKNAEALSVEAEFYCGNLFEAVQGRRPEFDLIVSNPPYIRSSELAQLAPEVRDHEPVLALDGAEDGLRFYREIAAQAGEYLSADGQLMVEIGSKQADEVCGILAAAGFSELRVRKDYAGLDRVVCGRKG